MSEQEGQSLIIYRVKLIALISVFLLPFIGGWLAFYVFDYRPLSQNYGALVEPVRPMSLPVLTTQDGRELKEDFWKKWSFVVLMDEDCADLCRNNLFYLRQMRIALGRDMDRVQNVLMLKADVNDDLAKFLLEYPKMTVLSKVSQSLFDAFELPGIPPGKAPLMNLIDPHGNLMMTYSAVNDPASVLSDMRRLLKLSQIG